MFGYGHFLKKKHNPYKYSVEHIEVMKSLPKTIKCSKKRTIFTEARALTWVFIFAFSKLRRSLVWYIYIKPLRNIQTSKKHNMFSEVVNHGYWAF